MTVDMHSHFFPGAAAGRGGPVVLGAVQDETVPLTAAGRTFHVPSALVDLEAQLAHRATCRVDAKVLQPPPFVVLYELPAAEGVRWSRRLNDAMAEAAAPHRGHLLPSATVPLQAGGAAAASELARVHAKGMRHVQILSSVEGASIAAPPLEPFWAQAARLEFTVSIHPHFVSGAKRMQEFHLRNLIGNPTETALAAAQLWACGVLERHPNLDVVLAHGGGTFPHLLGRLTHGYQRRSEFAGVRLTPHQAARRMRYDSLVFDPRILQHVSELVGEDRLVPGTDFPFDMGDAAPLDIFQQAGVGVPSTVTTTEESAWHYQ